EVGYGITDLWDKIVETLQEAPVSTNTELGQHMTAFETRVRQDTDEIYTRRAHAYIHHQMETEARLSREAWRRPMDASDLACEEAVISEMLKVDQRRFVEMRELRTTDHTRQQQLIQTLTVMQDSRDPLEVLYSQSCQRRLVAVHRLDHVLYFLVIEEIGIKTSHKVNIGHNNAIPNSSTTTSVTNSQLQAMIDQGVTATLAARDGNRNGDDSHTSGTGGRRTERVARECTYKDFMKCKPLYFKGTEGVIELTQWFKRMETIFLHKQLLCGKSN
ncbi:hypothetical protein Tco_1559551, partial [Tanacetum coccineum]